MGYYRNSNGIKCYEPNNDFENLYIEGTWYRITVQELFDRIKEHFGPDTDFNSLRIEAEHIQTRCIGYDLYDSSDYSHYLHIFKD